MDIKKLQQLIDAVGVENIPMIYTTVTNNTICGQAVSMKSIRETAEIAHKYEIPFMLDAARWAENCYFIKMNEEGYADKSIPEIAKEMFSYCDGFTASLKKTDMRTWVEFWLFEIRDISGRNSPTFMKTEV